eukprot:TRINITY_DN2650_c0_g1_i3.p2 TRINITY_DN2650_c0_g1~~TRINITY_DN2650_c0_g1_i3.p2  ORF type:complete len:228 (-),score=40.43 TRINITY_DN2650_c0_g1_i3:63-746(-)
MLPSFIAKVADADIHKNKLYLTKLGKYHINNEYYLDEFQTMKGVKAFEGIQNVSGIQEQCYAIITPIYFLHFQLLNPVQKIIRLVSSYQLTQLLNMKRKKTDNQYLLLQWKDKETMESLNYQFQESQAVINFIVEQMKEVEKIKQEMKQVFKLEEVNGEREFKGVDQNMLFQEIEEAEIKFLEQANSCLLYTSDAADEEDSVDLGGRRIIKKKNKLKISRRRIHTGH